MGRRHSGNKRELETVVLATHTSPAGILCIFLNSGKLFKLIVGLHFYEVFSMLLRRKELLKRHSLNKKNLC